MEQLRFLGVGSAFNAALGTNSAFFYREGNLYLLDCGETVFERALKAGLLERAKGIYVLITHLHSDHVGSLGTLLGYCYFILKTPATVVCPNPQLVDLLRLMDIAPRQYRLLSSLDEGGVRVAPVLAKHGGLIAYSYEISADGETVFYSGDTSELPETLVADVACGRIARAYVDCTDAPQSAGHMVLSRLEALVPAALRAKFTAMHLNCDYADKVKALGFACAKDLLIE